MLRLLGILGGLCFAYCGVPPAISAYRRGMTHTPAVVAWMIVAGSVFMYWYLTALHGFDLVLTVNYTVEAASWGTVLRFCYWPRPPLARPPWRKS